MLKIYTDKEIQMDHNVAFSSDINYYVSRKSLIIKITSLIWVLILAISNIQAINKDVLLLWVKFCIMLIWSLIPGKSIISIQSYISEVFIINNILIVI